MLDKTKPHRGKISGWSKVDRSQDEYARLDSMYGPSLHYTIRGVPGGHPNFINWIRTSLVVAREGNEIETLNSRYTLVD